MDLLKIVLLALAVTFAVTAVLIIGFDIISDDPQGKTTHLARQYHHLSKPEQAFIACQQLIKGRFKENEIAFEAFDLVSWTRIDTPAPLPDARNADYAAFQIVGPIRFDGRLQRFSCQVQSSPLNDWTLKDLLFGK